MDAKETVNRALDFLKNKGDWVWVPTPEIADGIGLEKNKDTLTGLCRLFHECVNAGLMEVRTNEASGTRKRYKWKVTESASENGWDRSNPVSGKRYARKPLPPRPREEEEPAPPHHYPKSEPEEPARHEAKRPDDAEVQRALQWSAGNQLEIMDLKKRVGELETELAAKEERLDKLEKLAATASQHVRLMKVERYDGKVIKLKDVILPAYFNDLKDLAEMRENILLVGPAGCGKTTVAELLAKTLGLTFGKIGGSSGLSETHLLGGKTHNITKGTEKWRPSEFVTRYEQGGLMLVDELDAADPNVLLALNPALDKSGRLPVPNRGDVAIRHRDFVCVATANTFGRGANRMYAGRNQLDEATLNRFPVGVIECYYDEGVEAAICPDDELRNNVQTLRRKVEEAVVRRVISTRSLESAYKMKLGKGWTWEKIQKQLTQGWTNDEKNKVLVA